MIWDDFLNKDVSSRYNGQIKTDIECPKCGRKIYYDSTKVLTTYPVKYSYWCSCGWSGTAYERWVENVTVN